MSFEFRAMNADQEVVWEAQAVVMAALQCKPGVAADLIRRRAATDRRSMVETAGTIVSLGVANFR